MATASESDNFIATPLRTFSTAELKSILKAHALWWENNGHKGAEADLSRADLRGASFRRRNLRGVAFNRSDLREADFTAADIRGAGLFGADLRGAKGLTFEMLEKTAFFGSGKPPLRLSVELDEELRACWLGYEDLADRFLGPRQPIDKGTADRLGKKGFWICGL